MLGSSHEWICSIALGRITEFSSKRTLLGCVPSIDSKCVTFYGGELFCSFVRCDERNSTIAKRRNSNAYFFSCPFNCEREVDKSNSTKRRFWWSRRRNTYSASLSLFVPEKWNFVFFYFFIIFDSELKCSKLIWCRQRNENIFGRSEIWRTSVELRDPLLTITRWKMNWI